VGFSPRTPEVIGEGGDETESPTIGVSSPIYHAEVNKPPVPIAHRHRPAMCPVGDLAERVGFSPRTPEVIGEGGDETESPTIEISRARERSTV
jgi:hypothetical protein